MSLDNKFYFRLQSPVQITPQIRTVIIAIVRAWFEEHTLHPRLIPQILNDGRILLESEETQIYVELADEQTFLITYKPIWYDSDTWQRCPRIKLGSNLSITLSPELRQKFVSKVTFSRPGVKSTILTPAVLRILYKAINTFSRDPKNYRLKPVGKRRYEISGSECIRATVRILSPNSIEIEDIEFISYFQGSS